jgi:5-methylcytosine-specific restriction protein A
VRSVEANEYRVLYKSAQWQRMRGYQLSQEPLCRFCAKQGRVEPASVVDHIKPHRGDRKLFFDGFNLQSLCKPCHDSIKQAEEHRGYSNEIGLDGRPVDPNHPANRV